MMTEHEDTNQDGADSFSQNAQMFAKFWTDFATKMAAAGFAAAPGSTPPDATRQVRAAIFKAMGEACDEFMRSVQFQEMMKQSLANAVQFRKQLNEWLGQMHHEFQGTTRQDVDQMMQVMEHLERRMADGFDRLSARLDGLEKRQSRSARPVPSPHNEPRRSRGKARQRSKS